MLFIIKINLFQWNIIRMSCVTGKGKRENVTICVDDDVQQSFPPVGTAGFLAVFNPAEGGGLGLCFGVGRSHQSWLPVS